MKKHSRAACLSAAAAFAVLSIKAEARDLVWDATPGDGVAHDGTGLWDLGTSHWVDSAAPGVNTTWDNTIPDSAIFGGTPGAETSPFSVDLASHIIVQDLTLANVVNNGVYSISSFSGGSLTLNGNLIKSGNDGSLNFFADTILSAGDHTITMRDTPNDVVEFIFNGVISGAGNLTINNDIYEAWGTLGLQQDNTYTGVTNINKGRVILTNSGGLGSEAAGSGTTIGDIGTLAFFGAGMEPFGNTLNVNEPITITRSVYSGGEHDRYRAAIQNNLADNIISGPITINSTDGRVEVNNDTTLTISGNVSGPGTLSVAGGSYGTTLALTGNNSMAGGLTILNRVTASVSSEANLGGASAPITFAGDGFLRINNGFMTTFGSHTINNSTFFGGLDIPTGFAFTVDQNLGDAVNAVGAIGKRGGGTLNLNSTINLRGNGSWWDSGVVNVNAPVTLHSLHLRSPEVNIGTGGSITITGGPGGGPWNSIGADSTGTNGGPDIAVVNITGDGQLIQTSTTDFNVSDNANTEGTINLRDNGVLTTNHLTFVGKNAGATGRINQSGGTFNVNRDGNFALVLGSRNGTGIYNLEGGTLNSEGEFYVGQGGLGVGFFNMSGGTVNQDHWFVVGREGGQGTVDLSGNAIFNKTRGGTHTEVDVSGGVGPSSMTIRESAEYRAHNGDFRVGLANGGNGTLLVQDSAKIIVSAGEFWVGNGGGATGVATLEDSASLAVNNNWMAIGRGTGTGTLNLLGNATLTKAGSGNVEIDFAGGGQGIVNVRNDAIFNIQGGGELWVGQGGGSNGQFNVQDNGAVSVNHWTVMGRSGGTGTLNLSGGSFTKTGGGAFILAAGGGSNGTFNQTGGTFNHTSNETWINEGGANGTWNMSGSAVATVDRLDVGRNGGGAATLNVSETAALTSGILRFGESGSVSGTVNLDGGTIQATQVVAGASSGAKTLNLNGGLLKAGASSTTWMDGPITANVKLGGARIDSNGFDAAVNTPLVHDPGLGATADGGLTKSGAGSLTLAAANTYTGGTTVNAGTLVAGHADAFNAGRSLTVNAGTTARAQTGLSAALDLGTLTMTASGATGGTLDLTDNALVLRNADTTAALASHGNVNQLVRNAFNEFAWNQPGITSTSVALDVANGVPSALGILLNNDGAGGALFYGDGESGASGLPIFEGRSVDANSVLVKYTLLGDGDLNGEVNSIDFSLFQAGYTNSAPYVGFAFGDYDYNGVVDSVDFSLFQAGYQASGARPTESMVAFATANSLSLMPAAVPEPATLGLLMTGVAGLMMRRRRSH